MRVHIPKIEDYIGNLSKKDLKDFILDNSGNSSQKLKMKFIKF